MSRDPEAQATRLQSKLDEICDAIGLPEGGGDGGYVVPNVERIADEHRRMRLALEQIAEETNEQIVAGRLLRQIRPLPPKGADNAL